MLTSDIRKKSVEGAAMDLSTDEQKTRIPIPAVTTKSPAEEIKVPPSPLMCPATFSVYSDIEDLKKNIADVLTTLMQKNVRCKHIPSIFDDKILFRSIFDFINMDKTTSEGAYIGMVILIDNLTQKGFFFNAITARCMLMSCLLLSTKYLDEEHYYNVSFSTWSGVPLSKLNQIERNILNLFEWNIGFIGNVEMQQAYFHEFIKKSQTSDSGFLAWCALYPKSAPKPAGFPETEQRQLTLTSGRA